MLTVLAYWTGLSLACGLGWVLRSLWDTEGMDTSVPDTLADLDPRGYFPTMDAPERDYPTITQVSRHGYVLHRGGKWQRVH